MRRSAPEQSTVARRLPRRRRSSARPLSKLVKVVLTVGAVAGAVGSIVGVVSTVSSPFTSHHGTASAARPAKRPGGTVAAVSVQDVRPLTYGEWTNGRSGSAEQQRAPGKLIVYAVTTRGYAPGLRLPVQLVLHDVTVSRSTTFGGEAIGTRRGATCGCEGWIPVPRTRDRYYVEVEVYPPGPIRGEPLRRGVSRYFGGTASA